MVSILQFILFAANLFFFLANASKIYFTAGHLAAPGALTFLGLGLNAITCIYFLPAVVSMFWRMRSRSTE